MQKLIAITGPTGIGKSRLAFEIAKTLGAEIISADSRQVYRFMDVGTAKPSLQERKITPHHLIDIVDPDEPFSLANFTDIASHAIDSSICRGTIPLLTGGTGQYVWAIVEGWEIPRIKPNTLLRNKLEERASKGEGPGLYKELKNIDPEAAKRIDHRNIRRVIRALEISLTGIRPGIQKKTPRYNSLIIGLTAHRSLLYQMIDERVEHMVEIGLKEEVVNLLKMGYSPDLPSMSGIGYRQMIRHLEGKYSLEEAITKIKNESHRLVRMQYNWFSLQDARIKWFDIMQPEYTENIINKVKGFIDKS